ncbi:hypothetical protein E0H73_07930 [Kribbella pittospori]|uniref:DUF3558 domain-containing protein n=1 Tax=Kribbella pittospori TaxID=722689 RepID=A0A4R0KUQ7_9ACTN|nr:hypothetical protein [Kribbella pittospori]TCC64329.1 hypothetical protein E0H73_07930 [Kribbella pittospori]
MHRSLLFAAAGVLLLGLSACDKEAAPPAADAKICGDTMASWWFDATGAPALTGARDGNLPLTNPGQTDATFKAGECHVFSEGKEVGRFRAELTTKDSMTNANASFRDYPAAGKFTVADGSGVVEPNTGDDVGRAWWTCKTTLLRVELYKPKDKDSRDELVKSLAQHIAPVVGCPGPAPG